MNVASETGYLDNYTIVRCVWSSRAIRIFFRQNANFVIPPRLNLSKGDPRSRVQLGFSRKWRRQPVGWAGFSDFDGQGTPFSRCFDCSPNGTPFKLKNARLFSVFLYSLGQNDRNPTPMVTTRNASTKHTQTQDTQTHTHAHTDTHHHTCRQQHVHT